MASLIPLGYGSRGRGGLLLKGQDHALIAVDLGIGFPGVAGLLHRGYVGKADVPCPSVPMENSTLS